MPLPVRLQVTPVLVALVTVALNFRDVPAFSVGVPGDTATETAGIVSVVETALDGSAFGVALIVTLCGVARLSGAV